MTTTELFFIALAFLLVGGFEQIADRCRTLLDILRPRPIEVPTFTRRSLYEPPKPGEKETVMPEVPFPPAPPPGYFDQGPEPRPGDYFNHNTGEWVHVEANPDHNHYDKDKDLGGVETAIPPRMMPAEPDGEEPKF